MDYKKILLIGAILGAISVILGAFGAHALKELIGEPQLASYKTGNTYQFYHSLLLIGIGILYKLQPSKLLRYAAWFCIIGVICFSGSLYILACRSMLGITNTMILGPITPIGGLLLTTSWILLIVNFLKKGEVNESV